MITGQKNLTNPSVNKNYKLIEDLVKPNEQELKILNSFNSSNVCIAAYSPYNGGEDFIFTYFNKAAEQAEKISKENVIGKKITEVFPGVEEFGLLNLFRYVFDTGESQHHQMSFYKDNRNSGWRENFVLRLPSGSIVALYFDQTDMMEILKESEEKSEIIEQFLENIQTYVCIFDTEGRIKFVNTALRKDLGYTLDEIKKMTVFDLRKYKNGQNINEPLNSILNGKSFDCNAPYKTKNGKLIPVKSKIYKIKLFGKNNFAAFSQNISYEIETEEVLQLQSAALHATADGIVITDKNGYILWVNPSFTNLTGYSKQEVLRQTPRILKSGLHDNEFYKNLWDTINSGKVWKGKIKNKKKDGTIYTEEMSITPILDENNNVKNFIAIKHDITQKEIAIHNLKVSEEKFKAITQNAVEAIITMDEKGNIQTWNNSASKIFGYTDKEVLGKNLHKTIVPERFRSPAIKAMKKFFITGNGNVIGKTVEVTAINKNKKEFPIELSLSKVKVNGKWNAIGVIRDISGRKAYETILKDSEKRFRDLVNFATVGIYRFDENSEILMINPALVKILGYDTYDEIIGLGKESVFAEPESRQHLLNILKLENKIYGYENKWKRKDGSIADIQESAWRINDLNGNFVYYEAIAEDITEQNQVLQILQESENKYRTLLDKLNDAVYLLVDNRFELVNNKFLELLEISYEDLTAKDFKLFNYIAPKSRKKVLERQKRLKNNEKVNEVYEFTLLTKSGKEKEVEASVSYINYQGKIATQGILRDITEKRRLETEVRHSQKMEAIGTLAAGIAHEINTPSQFVNDNLTFMKNVFSEIKNILTLAKDISRGKQETEKLKNLIEQADLDYLLDEIPNAINQSIEGVQRIAKIVGAMREFSHERPNEFVSVDLHNLINNTITISRNAWKYVADLETDFDTNIPPVKCLPGDMNQVIVNMIVNATHAIEDKVKDTQSKGLITIKTELMKENVKISILDNGKGIPENIISRIFDPFFTTKEVGKGTGQGLAIAYDIIVNKHHGTLDVKSKIGEGTEFIIIIPINRNENEAANE